MSKSVATQPPVDNRPDEPDMPSTRLAGREDTANPAAATIVARLLIETGCIHVRPGEPFELTSGRLSPVYLDCRRLISFPRARARICDLAVERIESSIGLESLDAVAGGETAGIPYAAWVAERLHLPMLYVRKKAKGFGRDARIEGHLTEGHRVLLVEDLATDGGSKLSFVEGLRDAGAVVAHTLVVFHYGIFPQAVDDLADAGVALHGLATWGDVIRVAERDGSLPPAGLMELRAFVDNPDGWTGTTDAARSEAVGHDL